MSGFPQEIDLSRTSHFLFEVGSLMVSVFGILLVIAITVVGVGLGVGHLSSIGLLGIGLFGLLSAFGVGLLYLSTRVTP